MFKGQLLKPNEGVAGTVSDNWRKCLHFRCYGSTADATQCFRITSDRCASLLAAPIMDRGALVGVVEVVNKLDGGAFDDDDLFTLNSLNDTASNALHNASLLIAERKVEILETLNAVSHEITSTLNLERMLQTIVNAPQAVIPYERAALALEQNGRFKLSAVTGLTQVNADAPDIAPLNDILQWARLSEEVIHVRQHGEEIDARPRRNAREIQEILRGFRHARISTPCRLNDDTGRVGYAVPGEQRPGFSFVRRTSKFWRFSPARPLSPRATRRCIRKFRLFRCSSRCSSANANSWPWKSAGAL